MNHFDHRKYAAAPRVALSNRQWPGRHIEHAPIWASVDLRDGNQALMEPMSVEQKRMLWLLLVKLGLKQIEVGFPSASQPDYDFVRWLIEEGQIPDDVTIQVLVQARESLIERTFESLKGIKQAIVHVYNSTSTIQRERVFGMSRDEITGIAVQGAKWLQREADKYPDTQWSFEYSPESFTDTEMDYAVEICDAVVDVWQPTPEHPCIINLPATVEMTTANVFADQVEYFTTHVKRRDSIVLSVHTHNDRGGAVASSELALLAGADRVEGTLLGNGERTGNMDILTMAMNLYSSGIDPKLDLSDPEEIARVYIEATSMPIHPRHPWIGELVYTAFSGSHQDAIRKSLHQQQAGEPWQVAYLPIDPEDIGRDYEAVVRVNSQSGKGGVTFVLERDYGLSLPRWMQVELSRIVQKYSETHTGEVNGKTIHKLFEQNFISSQGSYSLQGYHLDKNGGEKIQIELFERDKHVSLKGEGKGAIEAFINAWSQHYADKISVLDYTEHALTTGSDAEAICYVQLEHNGLSHCAAAIDQDTVSASLKAVLGAINRAIAEETVAA